MRERGNAGDSNWAYESFRGYGYHGQRYQTAPNQVELVGMLAEAACSVVAVLALELRVPRKPRWLLTLMRWLTPRRYEAYVYLEQTLWAEAIGFVAWKLREYFFSIHFDWSWGVPEQTALEAAMIVISARRCPKHERQRFIHPLKAALTFYDTRPTLEEAVRRLARAGTRGTYQRTDPNVLRELQRQANDLMEPWAFVYRWERLPE